MEKYLNFHNSSFALKYFLMQMARPQCDTPLVTKGKALLPSISSLLKHFQRRPGFGNPWLKSGSLSNLNLDC